MSLGRATSGQAGTDQWDARKGGSIYLGLHHPFFQAFPGKLSHLLVTCGSSEDSLALAPTSLPQSCAWNFKVLQNQVFFLAAAVYQIPIRPYKFLRRIPTQKFIVRFHLRRVRWLAVSAHPGRKELIKSRELRETSTLSV